MCLRVVGSTGHLLPFQPRRPRSSVDRAPVSGTGCAGSIPAGGTRLGQRPRRGSSLRELQPRDPLGVSYRNSSHAPPTETSEICYANSSPTQIRSSLTGLPDCYPTACRYAANVLSRACLCSTMGAGYVFPNTTPADARESGSASQGAWTAGPWSLDNSGTHRLM